MLSWSGILGWQSDIAMTVSSITTNHDLNKSFYWRFNHYTVAFIRVHTEQIAKTMC